MISPNRSRADCSLIRSTGFVEAKNERALPTKEGVVIRPALNGGVSATPLAIDPKLGLAYALTNESALKYYFFTSTEYANGGLWLGGRFKGVPEEPAWGDIVATDYNTGKIRWKVKKSLRASTPRHQLRCSMASSTWLSARAAIRN